MQNDKVISYEELRRIQSLERDEKALQELNGSFFDKIAKYIETKEKTIKENEGKDNVFSKQALEKNKHELINIKKIIKDICQRRRRKIVNQALNNISAKVHNTENMIPIEEELYNKTLEIVKNYTNLFMSKFERKVEQSEKKEDKSEEEKNIEEKREEETKKEKENVEKNDVSESGEEKQEIEEKKEKKDIDSKKCKLKINEQVPEFLWKDGQKYGPFEKEQEITLEKEIGEILIKGGKAIQLSD